MKVTGPMSHFSVCPCIHANTKFILAQYSQTVGTKACKTENKGIARWEMVKIDKSVISYYFVKQCYIIG